MTDDGVAATLITAGFEQLKERTPLKEGRVAPTRLFSGHDVRIVHMVLDEELREHTAPSPILVQVIEGRVRFEVEGQSHELDPGGMIHVAASVPHAVAPVGTARILVVLLDPGRHVHD
jgi:quercetin dioxygenase-like cupin family protein